MKYRQAFVKLATLVLASGAIAIAAAPAGFAQQTPAHRPATKRPAATPAAAANGPWWKHAIVYEIYPRSFQDSNGDGTGDLKGITQRLDKLQALGVDAIWIAPCYPSPQVDFGYDISDYENIDPQYGTLADFDRLLAEAKKRNIRVIMDMVLNHTSDKHKWFAESASSKTNPKRDWYIWRDGKMGLDGKRVPPNNWLSDFGHSAWQWDATTGQYYYHKFYAAQPDLNWRNPEVEKAMFDTMRFWLDRGVAGFRLDAIDTLFEDPNLADEEFSRDANGYIKRNAFGDAEVDGKKTTNLPETHDVLRRLRAMVASYPGDRVLIGETYEPTIRELDKWYGGAARDELQLPMDMQFGMENHLDATAFRKHLLEIETEVQGNQPLLVYDNHDNPRLDRYCKPEAGAASGANCAEIQQMLATILFTSRATALMYYGDEIGMVTTPPRRVQDVRDPVGILGWPKEKGRDGERTPMQWTPGKDAGFSTAAMTWLPIPPDYGTTNVQTETPEKQSMLNWYKLLIQLRRKNAALLDGDQTMLATSDDKDVLAYTRGAGRVLVVCNFSGSEQTVSVKGLDTASASVLAANYPAGMGLKLGSVSLPGYGAVVAELK